MSESTSQSMNESRPAAVTKLRARPVREGIALTWEWPSACTFARIVRRTDGWPTGPEDPAAIWHPVSRSEYLSAGGRFVDRLDHHEGRFHYVVYAQQGAPQGAVFASGDESGCRAAVDWEPWITVQYELRPLNGAFAGRLRLDWAIDRVSPDFSGFALVANPNDVPRSLEDGVELFRWSPWMDHSGDVRYAYVDLGPARERRWERIFCKAMTVDPAQRHTTLFIHPNTCVPVGSRAAAERAAMSARRYTPGPPSSVICPSCFDEFPASAMLFASYGDEAPELAQRSLLDWLRGAPPRPPVNRDGRRLTRKLCPACGRDLPFTAGVQKSLVLGMIGAKFSGKSHYVASLIQRLEGPVGSEFDASLIAVNDETQERYRREFFEPLFGRGLELPVTIGTPPPLIYDLAVGGIFWGDRSDRNATLSLYDTAGENFDNRESVRQMLAYLRVASGVILLVDPLQAPAVREALHEGVGLPDLDRMAEPHAIVSRVIQELDNGALAVDGQPLQIPIAVVLTKCDVLRDAGLIEPNRLWSTDAHHAGYYDRLMHEDISGMFGEYLLRWSPATYTTIARRFPRHAFFGVSATGCASDPATRRFRHITPWRVEEPLLWLLAQIGLVPTH